jgi:hypothetical protein
MAKIGRNDLCRCGNGKKYKRLLHGPRRGGLARSSPPPMRSPPRRLPPRNVIHAYAMTATDSWTPRPTPYCHSTGWPECQRMVESVRPLSGGQSPILCIARGSPLRLKSVAREIRTMRSVGVGGGRPPLTTRFTRGITHRVPTAISALCISAASLAASCIRLHRSQSRSTASTKPGGSASPYRAVRSVRPTGMNALIAAVRMGAIPALSSLRAI